MSRYVSFDLDELSSLRFQELCNSLLLKHFSQLIDCMVRPGKDNKCDGRSEMLPINYSDLLNTPFGYKSADGVDVLYVFQCKHTQGDNEAPRQKSVINALKEEISKWKQNEKRPTHYILLTNVNLKASQLEEVCSLGRSFFGFFDIWHEPKISGYISLDIGLQRTFFPNRLSNIDIASLGQAMQIAKDITKENLDKAACEVKVRSDLIENDVGDSVQALVDYEIRFQKANQSLSKAFQIFECSEEVPEEWVSCSYEAKDSGILVLTENVENLQWVSNLIACNEAKVTIWQKYLGEEVKHGESLITLKCNPEVIAQLIVHLNAVFKTTPIANPAYEQVDKYLRKLESKILKDIRACGIQDVQDELRQIYRIRQSYSQQKAEYSSAFYPNVRTFGGKPIIGWDFLTLWGNILTNIYDVAFSDTLPDALYELLLSLPFIICGDAVKEKRSKESFRIDLELLKIPLGVIVKMKRDSLTERFIDKLENLAQEIADIDVHMESFSQAEWAVEIASELARHIANLGWLTLSKRVPQLPFGQLEKILHLTTSLSFDSILHNTRSLNADYLKQKDLQKAIISIRNEYIYAWATFAWSQERVSSSNDPTLAIRLLKQLRLREVIALYNSNKFKDGWITQWFMPEGKRASWSWSMDHDIRESLQLAILVLPIKVDDFKDFMELADQAWSSKFLEEVRELCSQLVSKGLKIDCSQCVSILQDTISSQALILKGLLVKQPLSEQRVKEVQAEFQEKVSTTSKEGILYSIADISTRADLKSTHAVGPYFLDDKNYFIDQLGSVSYLNKGIGSNCARILNEQRDQLVIECAKKSVESNEYDPDQLGEILEKIHQFSKDDHLLVVPYSVLSQIMNSPLFQTKKAEESRHFYGKIGLLNVMSSAALQHGEMLILPHLGFVWYVDKKVSDLNIKLIDKNSELAAQIIRANPNIAIEEKVLIEGREKGIMIAQRDTLYQYFKEQSAQTT